MTFENQHTGETITLAPPVNGVSDLILNGKLVHRVRFCDVSNTATIDGRTYAIPDQFTRYLLSLIEPRKGAGRDGN